MSNLVKIVICIFGAFISMNINAISQEYVVNMNKSSINWLGAKIGGSHKGTIKFMSGNLIVESGVIKEGVFIVDMKSLKNTDISNKKYRLKLEKHLKSPDFFGVNNYPFAKLEITNSELLSGNNYLINAMLTIKGNTKEIEFTAKLISKMKGLSFDTKLVLKRRDFNIKYKIGSYFDAIGDNSISDEFYLDIALILD